MNLFEFMIKNILKLFNVCVDNNKVVFIVEIRNWIENNCIYVIEVC